MQTSSVSACTVRRPRISSIARSVLVWLIVSCPLDASSQETHEGKIIRDIQLEGLQRLSPAEVLTRMSLRPGQPFRQSDLDAEVQRLWETGEFNQFKPDVIPDGDGVIVVFTFVEKRRIVEVRYEGNRNLRRSELEPDLRTRPGGLFNEYEVKSDTRLIRNLYRQKGFNFVEVEEELRQAGKGIVVTFRIQEGTKVRIKEIRFKGNNSFPSSTLNKRMETRRQVLFGGVFDPDKLQLDIRRLKHFYRQKGFLDVKIAAEDFAFSFDRDELYLGIRVDEGPRYTVSKVEFEFDGKGVFQEEELRREMRVQSGTPYDGDLVQADQRRILRMYRNRAYIDAEFQAEIVPSLEGNDITLLYRIKEGQEAYIESVEIRGNLETKDKVIRRELTFFPGEKINVDKWEESQSNLIRLRYFEGQPRIYPERESGSLSNQRNVVVEVEEGSTGQFIFGFGVTSGLGAIGNFSLVKRNFDIFDLPESFWDIPTAFTGAGQTLIIDAQPGTELSRYQITFIEPYLADTPTSLTLRGFRNTFNRSDYTERRTSGRISLGRRFLRNLRGELSYRYEVVNIRNLDADAPPDAFAVRGNNRISALGVSASYDRRRFAALVGPTSGFVATAGYEYAGGFLGAEVDIHKATASFNIYRTLYVDPQERQHILTFRNTVQWADNHHNTPDVPIFERYFLGGPRTVRGFRFLGLGPHINQDAIGGSASHYGSLEYTFPIFDNFLRGTTFVDYGNLAEDVGDYRGDEYRLTLGAGVIININLFGQRVPITLSWGEAVESEDDDRERLFLFDIGRLGF